MDRRAMVQAEWGITVLSGELEPFPEFPDPVLFVPDYVAFGQSDQLDEKEVPARWRINEPSLDVEPADVALEATGPVTLDGRAKQPGEWLIELTRVPTISPQRSARGP